MNATFSSGIAEVADLAKDVIDRVVPNPIEKAQAQFALKQLQDGAEARLLAAQTQLSQMQADIDKAEAANPSTFVAGWRPFAGWVSGFSLAYVAIVDPIGRFIAEVGFHYTGNFPVIDTTITMQVLLGMLGLAAARSYDKKQGTDTTGTGK